MDVNNKIFGLTIVQLLAALGALLGLIGAFLPWVSWSHMGTSASAGAGGDGILTLFLSILVLGVIFSDRIQSVATQGMSSNNLGGQDTAKQISSINTLVKTWSNIILLAFGAIILLVALRDLGSVGSVSYWIGGTYGAGIGLWMTLLGGLLIVLAIVINLVLFKAPLMPSDAAGQFQRVLNPTPQQAPPAYSQQPGSPAPQPSAQAPISSPVGQKVCPHCGAPNKGEKFCGSCGKQVN